MRILLMYTVCQGLKVDHSIMLHVDIKGRPPSHMAPDEFDQSSQSRKRESTLGARKIKPCGTAIIFRRLSDLTLGTQYHCQ